MSLIRTFFHVNVSETDHDRNYWATRANLGAITAASIRSAEVLLVPWENRSKEGLSFPLGTADFFHTLSRRLGEGKIVIAAEPSHYQELALHGGELRWPSIIVSGLLLPTLVGILSDEVEKLMASWPPAIIEINITVENERGKCISIDYKGPPGRLVETLVQESARCLPPLQTEQPQTKPSAPPARKHGTEKPSGKRARK